MNTIELRDLVDKSRWPRGPWDDEPDLVIWEVAGLACVAYRFPEMGQLNGYVEAPAGLHGRDCSYIEREFDTRMHWGMTWAGTLDNIEHLPDELRSKWFVGFDCAHAFDVIPAMLALREEMAAQGFGDFRDVHKRDTYKTIDYVKRQCACVALQLSKL